MYFINYEYEHRLKANDKYVMPNLRKYAKLGNHDALLLLIRRLRTMNGLKTDNRATLNILKKESNKGNFFITRIIADYYMHISNYADDTYARASVALFTKAYKQGCNLSLLFLADCYYYGFVYDSMSLAFTVNFKAADLSKNNNTYIKIGKKTNIAALFRIGKYYYKICPYQAITYFECAASSIQCNDDIEESSFHALYYLGLLAAKSVHGKVIFFPKNTTKKSAFSYDLVQAIYFMRLAATTEANEWLSARGLSKTNQTCADCEKPAQQACSRCGFTFFCSRKCFYDMGTNCHEQFCLLQAR